VELGEVESALSAHPEVLEAVVVPLPHPQFGHRIVASVVPRAGVLPKPAELRAFCSQRLPLYMVPDTSRCWAPFRAPPRARRIAKR